MGSCVPLISCAQSMQRRSNSRGESADDRGRVQRLTSIFTWLLHSSRPRVYSGLCPLFTDSFIGLGSQERNECPSRLELAFSIHSDSIDFAPGLVQWLSCIWRGREIYFFPRRSGTQTPIHQPRLCVRMSVGIYAKFNDVAILGVGRRGTT